MLLRANHIGPVVSALDVRRCQRAAATCLYEALLAVGRAWKGVVSMQACIRGVLQRKAWALRLQHREVSSMSAI